MLVHHVYDFDRIDGLLDGQHLREFCMSLWFDHELRKRSSLLQPRYVDGPVRLLVERFVQHGRDLRHDHRSVRVKFAEERATR